MKNKFLKLAFVLFATIAISTSAKSQSFEINHIIGISCPITYVVYDALNLPLTPVLGIPNTLPNPTTCFSGTPAYVVFSGGCNGGTWTIAVNNALLVGCSCIGAPYTFSVTYATGVTTGTGPCPAGNDLLQINF